MEPAGPARVERRLAAILAADVAGYSRLMGADEEGTLAALKAIRRELGDPKIAEHRGRIVKTTGDGLLVEFQSVVDAVRCAVEVQRAMADRNADVPADKRIEFRLGIHQGDIIVEDGDIFGDGVNLAARLEGLAEPGGICVSGRVRADAVGKVDAAFDDLGEQSLKNIARPLRVFAVRIEGAVAKTPPPEKLPLPLPGKPSIAALPFQNMSGDPEQEYFADGMVEEITTALSRIRWLFVIARNSSFTYKGRAVDVKQVGRELGVRYVLEGSVRKAGSRVRITAQLIETTAGAHLWADRFDGSLEDVFELQDEVASSVAGVIEPTLQVAEIRRSTDRPTGDMTAYDLYLRALSHTSTWEKGDIVAALDLLGQAIERDPHYGPALALAAQCHYSLHVNSWASDPELSHREGVDLSRQALRVASDDPGVLGVAAAALAYFGEDIHAAIELIERALALNPSFARGWVTSGRLRLWAGQPELAISHFETSLRLSPHAHRSGTLMEIGLGYFCARRFEDAVVMLLRSLQEHPGWAPTYRFLAACYAHMGRLDEARETIKRLKAVTPVVMPNAMHWRNPEHRELFLSGLRLAADEAT
jgi:TolB-like protein/class 3 adenylate cyclase